MPDPAPPLLPENELAEELFSACQTQIISIGMGGVVGVSHDQLEEKMRRRGIEDPDEALELEQKFLIIESVFVKSCQQNSKS